MSQSRLVFFIVTFVICSFHAIGAQSSEHKKLKYQSLSINSILNSKKLFVSKEENKLANNIVSLYKIITKGYVNKTLLSKLLKDLKGNDTFFLYKEWLVDLDKIVKSNSLVSTQKICEKIVKKKSMLPVNARLLWSNKQICFQHYLNLMGKQDLTLSDLSNKSNFYKNHMKYFTAKGNISELTYVLSKYQRSSSHKKFLSQIIADHYIFSKKIPPSELFQYMDINHELTKYIQITGLEKNSTQNIILGEFTNLVDTAYEASDKNEDARVVASKVKNVLNYYNLSSSSLPSKASSIKLIGLGKSLMRRSYFKICRDVFKTVIHHSHDNVENAKFELLWSYITNEDYDEAYDHVIKKYNMHKNYNELRESKTKFWIAFTLKEENKKGFDKLFKNIIKSDPLSYYAILSSKFLEHKNNISSNTTYLSLLNENNKKRLFTDLRIDKYTYRSLKRLKIWSQLDYKPFIESETKSLTTFYSNELLRLNENKDKNEMKDFLSYLTAKVISHAGNHLETFKSIYRSIYHQSISLDEDVLSLLYPMPYWDKIQKYAQNTDPIIPLSLIRQESAFNRMAKSHVGARGLMQLMPYTARQYQRKLKTNQLHNPNLNLKIGNLYLNKLMQDYDQNLVYVLSAYNAGEGRVNKWRTQYLTSDSILHNIENIPFSETRKYVKLIFRNIYFYKLLNDEKSKLNLADSKKPNKIFNIYLGFNN